MRVPVWQGALRISALTWLHVGPHCVGHRLSSRGHCRRPYSPLGDLRPRPSTHLGLHITHHLGLHTAVARSERGVKTHPRRSTLPCSSLQVSRNFCIKKCLRISKKGIGCLAFHSGCTHCHSDQYLQPHVFPALRNNYEPGLSLPTNSMKPDGLPVLTKPSVFSCPRAIGT